MIPEQHRSGRAAWLRAAVLGADDAIVSTASLMIGVAASAGQLGIDFVPLFRERFDLAMRRRDFFEPPVQRLLAFARGPECRRHADRLGGYDLSRLGEIVLNQ